MPPIQKSIQYFGFGRQTAGKGTPVTVAQYGLGTLGGASFVAAIDQDNDPQTLAGNASDRFAPSAVRTAIHPGVSIDVRAYPRSAGALFYGALGTTVLSGAGPFLNTIVPAQVLPYWTCFGRIGSFHERVVDAVVNTVSLEFNETEPATVHAEFMGSGAPLLTQAAPTYTVDESIVPFMGGIGGTFSIDVNGTTLATTRLTGFTCEVNNNLEEVMLSAAITPDDVFPALQTVEGTIKVKPTDMVDWLGVLTGADAGTTLSNVPVYGSFSVKIVDPVTPASNSLTLTSLRAPMITDFPEGDPEGGAVELEFAYRVTRPLDASAAFTAIASTVATLTY